MLTQHGCKVRLLPLPLGFAGTIHKTNMSAIKKLGITRAQAVNVMKALHMHAITCLHNILKEHRYLERCSSQTTQTQKLTELSKQDPDKAHSHPPMPCHREARLHEGAWALLMHNWHRYIFFFNSFPACHHATCSYTLQADHNSFGLLIWALPVCC